ncbi:uncharacterized protein LOC119688312 [Teleopsis dalmanni]|uniref:uncharacterized protein LOC119688312 n=1 Tax=Teleopsis dalmanni TaxID=139649 RepID=UPI0018CE7CB1|nr:uncharacterized protein LOC119688312 [Teleopsis dalmanni]
MSSTLLTTEVKDMYKVPPKRIPLTTRSKYMQDMLFQEYYDEYIKQLHYPQKTIESLKTEYLDKYYKDVAVENAEIVENLRSRFPLYRGRAITFWNQSGDEAKQFNLYATITKSVHLQNVQFG